MTKKVAIISDSTGCLTEDITKKYDIFTSYLMIIFGNESYQEFKEITPDKFIELTNAQSELPSTSQPSIGLTVELYEKILADGYDEIVHITISSALSGSYQSAVSASNMVDENKIHIFDSKTVAYPQGALAVEAAKMANSGKDSAEILANLEKLKNEVSLYAGIYDMTNLRKGGRVSHAKALLGSLMNVKPLITVTENGDIQPAGKVRTFKKVIGALVEKVQEAKLTEEDYEIGVMHIGNPEAAEQLKAEIRAIYPNITINDRPLSLVVAVHAGEGACAISWIKTNV